MSQTTTSATSLAGKSALSFSGSSSSELSRPELRRIKQAIIGIMLVLALLIAARLWCLEGLLFPVHIAGASMGDTLAGPHFRVTCADCGHQFRCDASATPQSQEAECPNCGYAHNRLQPSDYRPGEQVLIDRWMYLLERPQRGDMVAFTHPDDDAPRVVKRIVGLPGEQIAIRRGDIIVDGQPATKNLAQLSQQATLIYDSQSPPRKTADLPARWQADAEETYWVQREGTFYYRSQLFDGKAVKPQTAFDWLSFRNFRRLESPQPHPEFSAALDFDAYNPADNRSLNSVSDLLLTCRASIAKYGCLVFAGIDGADRFEVHLCHDERKLKLFQNGKILREELLPHRNHDVPIDIQFALCDQRVLFGMDGRQVLAQSYQRTNLRTRSDKLDAEQPRTQLQIGGAGARIRISQAKVYRDLYYLPPFRSHGDWHAEQRIPANCYLVLGDNPPVSIDSRQWPNAEVPRANIRGRVVKPWWSN